MSQGQISIDRLSSATFQEYIAIGTTSYNQHYQHLWPNNDCTPYIENSFTVTVLEREMEDANTDLFIVHFENQAVGILKIVKDSMVNGYTAQESILLEKIYLLKEYSGRGIGMKILDFVEDYAKDLNKKVLWLDTMKKGPALQFYLNNGFSIQGEKLLGFEKALEEQKPMYILIKKLARNSRS